MNKDPGKEQFSPTRYEKRRSRFDAHRPGYGSAERGSARVGAARPTPVIGGQLPCGARPTTADRIRSAPAMPMPITPTARRIAHAHNCCGPALSGGLLGFDSEGRGGAWYSGRAQPSAEIVYPPLSPIAPPQPAHRADVGAAGANVRGTPQACLRTQAAGGLPVTRSGAGPGQMRPARSPGQSGRAQRSGTTLAMAATRGGLAIAAATVFSTRCWWRRAAVSYSARWPEDLKRPSVRARPEASLPARRSRPPGGG